MLSPMEVHVAQRTLKVRNRNTYTIGSEAGVMSAAILCLMLERMCEGYMSRIEPRILDHFSRALIWECVLSSGERYMVLDF